ncbi:MAG: NAD(P)/FAD-dependent oxidoreductase [Alphaproteobacteria bacterium]|nr:NAD(P)/FAD-dependent oxidoreductase [Alphaproteobacteria bacterium]
MELDFDAVVVGAGVIGLAAARALARTGSSVVVLEKADRAGAETSSRNSEVIHAGIYYPQGSLKAKLCVDGRRQLYDYCASHGVETRRLGKIIAATSLEEEAKLASILALAQANGVDDLQWLSAAEVAALEPELRCTRALFSPSTGIVDAQAYMLALQGEAEALGTDFAFRTDFSGAKMQSDAFVVSADGEDGQSIEITSRYLINCAGHGAHAAAAAIAGFPTRALPPRFLAKGSYCSLPGKSPFKHLIYPVPVSGALGIHATLDLAGAVRFGPNIEWIDRFDYALPDHLEVAFAAAVKSYWPGVSDHVLSPSYCGIRPKIHGPDVGFADFKIQDASEHGIIGLVNLFGIESPGLTSSLAIADVIADRLDQAR